MKYIIFAILLVFAGCVTQDVNYNSSNSSSNGTFINTTNNTTSMYNSSSSSPDTSELGDIVKVDYILYVNDTVYDTSIESVAKENDLYEITRKYEPLQYEVSFNKGMIEGFVINTIGMKINSTEIFTVDPARGYGPYDPTKKFSIKRFYNMSFIEEVPRAELEAMFQKEGLNLTIGSAFKQPSGDVIIQNITNDTVTIFYVLVPGKEFILYDLLPQKINSTNSSVAVIENLYIIEDYYYVPDPMDGQVKLCKVSDKNEEIITFDCNHKLANETLKFQVTMVDIFKKG